MAKRAKKAEADAPPPPTGPIIVDDCEQGSEEWHQHRLGIPTASNFHFLLAQRGDGSGRDEYMRKLAGERFTGEPMQNFTSKAMERGRQVEPEAISAFEILEGMEVHRVAFVKRRDGLAGASPDGLIGDRRMLEIKSEAPHILIETIRSNRPNPKWHAQMQGNLWIAEREEIGLGVYYPKMPMPRFWFRRDEAMIRRIEDAVRAFNEELDELVDKIDRYGRR